MYNTERINVKQRILVLILIMLAISGIICFKRTNYYFLTAVITGIFALLSYCIDLSGLGNKKIYPAFISIIAFVLFLVISSEFILRKTNIKLTLEYIKSTSFAYNLIFVSLVYLFIISISGKKLGTILMLIVHFFIIASNFIKLRFFNEPFYIWDMFLIRNALIIYKDYVDVWIITASIIILSAALVLILKNFRSLINLLKPIPNIKLALLLALPLILNFNLLNNDKLHNVRIFKDWHDGIDEFLRNGTYVQNYLYLKDIGKYINKRPDNYNIEKITRLKSEIPSMKTEENLKPNVVVILSETFWDPNNLSNIQINKTVNKNMNKYRSGTLVSSKFGWATANIEFEILTGLSNFYFNEGVIPYNVYLNRNIPSVISAFRQNGYTATAIHPNIGSMYNRTNAYKCLGFNNFKDISSFDTSRDVKGNYVSDDKVIDMIIKTLNESEGPKFIFAATIQNHDPYDNNSKKYINREVNVVSNKLDDTELEILSNFSQGVYDADRTLGRLIEELKKNKYPTLVYYFGDHLPRLGAPKGIYDIYEKLSYIDKNKKPGQDQKFYETPIITWSNYKKMSKFPVPISPNQLAVEILMDSGINYPIYFNYLLKLREKYPSFNRNLMARNTLVDDDLISNYYLLQYDIMFGNQYLIKDYKY